MATSENISTMLEHLAGFEAQCLKSAAELRASVDLFRDARVPLPELYAGSEGGVSGAAVMARAERAARVVADAIRDLRQTLGKVHRAGLEDLEATL